MLYMQKCAKYWTFHKLKQWSNIPQELLQQTWSGTKTSETADCCIQRQEESLKSVFWFHHNQHRDGLSLIKIPLPAPAPDPLNNSWRNWSPEALSGGGHRSSFRWPPIHPEEPENVTNCLVHVGRESDLWFYLRPSGHSTAYVHSASPAKADLSERCLWAVHRFFHPPEQVNEIQLLERSQHSCCHNQADEPRSGSLEKKTLSGTKGRRTQRGKVSFQLGLRNKLGF